MSFTVYLSGEIHTEWRNEIKEGAQKNGLDIEFVSAETDHDASDAAGDHLGGESNLFWHDHKSAKVNAIRTKTLIKKVIWSSYALETNTSSGMLHLTLVIVRLWEHLMSLCIRKTLYIP